MDNISNFVTKEMIWVHPECPLNEASNLMKENKIGSLLIRDDEGKLIGIFTERDFITKLDFNNINMFNNIRVKDVMTSPVITTPHDVSYVHMIKEMRKNNIRHLIIEKEGDLVGVVSLRDLMIKHEAELESVLKEQESQLLKQMSKIQESEHRIRTIFENSAAAIVFLDKRQRLVEWNPLAEQISGIKGDDLENKQVKDFFPADEWKKIRFDKMVEVGGTHAIETKIIDIHGHLIDIDLSINVLKRPRGEITGFVGVFRDISKRKRAEESLSTSLENMEEMNVNLERNQGLLKKLAAERERAYEELQSYQEQIVQMGKMATLGTLAAGFAHGVKNPLGIIMQGMEYIEAVLKPLGEAKHAKYVAIIKNATARANDVVISLLKFSRSSKLELDDLYINEVIENAWGFLGGHSNTNRIEFKATYNDADKSLRGDRVMLQQVFVDLFVNAVHAMPDGGELKVTVCFNENKSKEKKGGDFIIEVQDTGCGIPEEYMNNIFDPFVTTKDEGEGIGLGLSTVYLIVERHSGTIAVESKENKGAKFTITLPLDGAAEIKRRFDYV